MSIVEKLLPLILPLLADYADNSLPEGPKRVLYVLLVCLGEEGQAYVKTTQAALDDATFDALVSVAQQEFVEAGLPSLPSQLDGFVKFRAAA